MPTLEEELFGPADAAGGSLEDSLFGPGDPAAVDDAKKKVAAAPPAPRPLTQPQHARPWYENLVEDVGKSTGATILENIGSGGLANTADEMQAGIATSEPMSDRWTVAKMGPPPADPNTYAAGSAKEDARRVLEAEKLARDRGNPKTAVAGQIGGAALQGAALPAAALTNPLIAAPVAAALTGANYMGQGSGDLESRGKQAIETAKENPISTAASVVLPAAASGVGHIASRFAPAARAEAQTRRVGAVMTPPQMEALANNSSLGPEAVRRLGADIEARNLHKSKNWWENFWPAKAERYYENADMLREQAGPAIGKAEDALVAAGNPEVPTAPTVDILRRGAERVENLADPAGKTEGTFSRNYADNLERRQTQLPVEGARAAPLEPSADLSPDEAGHEWTKYFQGLEDAQEPLPNVATGRTKFSDALDDRRRADQLINWNSRAGHEGAGSQEATRRQVATGLRQNMSSGLDEAVAQGQIPQELVDNLNKANKDYSVASAVRDPALSMMMKDYGGGMGLKDMASVGVLSSLGVPSAAAVAGNMALKGRLPSLRADRASKWAGTLEGLSSQKPTRAVTAITQAELVDPGEDIKPSSEEAKQANESVVEQLQEAGAQSWDWIKQLTE